MCKHCVPASANKVQLCLTKGHVQFFLILMLSFHAESNIYNKINLRSCKSHFQHEGPKWDLCSYVTRI